MNQDVILVNEQDVEVGVMEKLEVHKKGLLHRAFSVFVVNTKGEFLLQKRALTKYHSAGLWTNTCCSHPYPKEDVKKAANRRLKEEMGMEIDPIFAFTFQYKIAFENGLIENEMDHVFFAVTDFIPLPNAQEVDDWKYLPAIKILQEIAIAPNLYTEWFKLCFVRLSNYLIKNGYIKN